MQYVAAYALLNVGGNTQPSCSDIKNLLSEIGVDGSDDLIGLLVYSLRGKQLQSVIDEGLSVLKSYSQNGGLIEKKSEELRNNYEIFKKQEEEKLKQIEEEKRREQEMLRRKQIELEEQKKRQEEERQKQIQQQRELERKQKEQEEIQRQFELKKKQEEEERQKQIQLQLQREQEQKQRELEEKKKKEEEERQQKIQLQLQREQEQKQKELEERQKKEEEERQKQIQLQIQKEQEQQQRELQEKKKKEEEEKLQQNLLEEQKKIEEKKKQQYLQDLKEKELQILEAQKKLTEELQQKKPVEKIAILEKEVQAVSNSTTVTKSFQTYQIAKCEQQKLQILKESNQVRKPTPIYHMDQQITVNNQEVLFHVISENLMRDQKRELIITPQAQKIGLTSALFAESEDQKCLKFRTTQANFEEINNNAQKKADFILDFKQKVSQNLKIPIDEIEILDIVQGSVQVLFTTKTKPELNQNELQVLEQVCGGKVEVYNYFAGNGNNALVGLSSDDFTPQYNMQWGPTFQEKEQRGPKYHRYDYYFPRGYYGYALNVLNKYGLDNRWIQMDGNDEEWRILYHGTKHGFMKAIVDKGLAPGTGQAHQSDICSFSNQTVGPGVYFSDKISICESGYAAPTTIGNKRFVMVFQSRVNPKAVRQSPQMKRNDYYVVNSSKDIRPYRILLKEV